MAVTVGADLSNAVSDFTDGKSFDLGDTYCYGDKEYVYVQADGAIVSGDVCIISEAHQADQIDTTNSAGAIGDRVGVAVHAFADNEYGFLQIAGPVDAINVGSSAAANTKLNTTATAGRIDDDATSGAETILGLVTTAAESSNSAAGILHRPWIDATL